MNGYWTLAKAAKAKFTAMHKSYKGELAPRFIVSYQFATKLGQIEIKVTTQGRYVFTSVDAKGVKKANTELALREVEKLLSMAGFAS